MRKFQLYLEYRAQLQSYTKMYFDSFRRYDRITFVLETDPTILSIESTVGQLNFFRWALHNNVIEYITSHLTEIEDEMSSFHNEVKSKEKDKTYTKKRVVIVKPPNTFTHAPCFVRFD